MPHAMSDFSPSQFFPPADECDADGLLGVGGSLETEWLIDAYTHGIFPWPASDALLAWWSPDPRAVLELDQLRISRRLRRTCRGGRFRVSSDEAFTAVIDGCRTAQDRAGATWITRGVVRAYTELHRAGTAHSIEVWRGEKLVGGLYGVGFGAAFSAESMFYRERDASKVALVHLTAHLESRGYRLLDIQQLTPHLERLGATEIPRREFLARLADALEQPVTFGAALESRKAAPSQTRLSGA